MPFEINHESPIPLHAQVEEKLRDLIKEKEYRDGKLLPNEVELAKKLGISRNTLRQATNKLVYEGLLVRKKGVGTKVTQGNVTTRLDNWLSFTQEMNEKGIPFKNYEINVEWVSPNDEASQFFNLPDDKSVLKMSRLRGMESGPIVHFISYFHPRVGLTGREDFSRSLYKILEDDYSTIVSTSKEEITAMAADDFIAEKLNIQIGEPVLFRKRFVSDPGGRPVEYNIGFYKAESFKYSIEIKRNLR